MTLRIVNMTPNVTLRMMNMTLRMMNMTLRKLNMTLPSFNMTLLGPNLIDKLAPNPMAPMIQAYYDFFNKNDQETNTCQQVWQSANQENVKFKHHFCADNMKIVSIMYLITRLIIVSHP